MNKAFRFSWSLAIFVALNGGTADLMGQEFDPEARINEIDERLSKLEEAYKSRENSTASSKTEKDRNSDIEELRRQVDVLSYEIEKLRSGDQEIEISSELAASLGPSSSAALVYRKSRRVSIAGYGEILYENFDGEIEGASTAAKKASWIFLSHPLCGIQIQRQANFQL